MMTKEQRAAYKKAYREANPEKIAAKQKIYQATYRAAHPNKYLADSHKVRANKAGVKIGDEKAVLHWLNSWRTEAPAACHYCMSISPGIKMTIDHVIPMSKGGPHDLTNLVVCCSSCNNLKQDKLPEEWQAFKAAC